MFDLNLFYLKCFLDAVLMGSISESARRNHVTQSAVSQAIKKLGKSLKINLSTNKKQHFELTEEGKIVFQKAEEIFSTVRNLYDALGEYERNPRTPLHFVTTHSIGLSLLPYHLTDYRKHYPQIDVHFQFGGLTQIKGWLKQGIAEFALVIESPVFAEYQKIPFFKGHFKIYKHREEVRSLEQIGAYVENEMGLMVPEYKKAYSTLNKKSLPTAAELNNWELIARTVEQDKGYGLLPDFITFDDRYPSLEATLTLTLPYTLCAIFHKGKPLSYSATIFMDSLKMQSNDKKD